MRISNVSFNPKGKDLGTRNSLIPSKDGGIVSSHPIAMGDKSSKDPWNLLDFCEYI
jgi:hypothetical protein